MTADYIVFVRYGAFVTIYGQTSSYEDAHRRARKCGGSVMFADHFHATYKPEEISR